MADRDLITAEELRQILHYDPETGIFTWLARPLRPEWEQQDRGWNTRQVGTKAGALKNGRYIHIRIYAERTYLAHRLAWLYVTGSWPQEHIDHINCVKMDNRFSNLREATRLQNNKNVPHLSTNLSGLKGAHFDNRDGRYYPRIMTNGVVRSLGGYDTAQEAHEAYCKAAVEYHGEFANFD